MLYAIFVCIVCIFDCLHKICTQSNVYTPRGREYVNAYITI